MSADELKAAAERMAKWCSMKGAYPELLNFTQREFVEDAFKISNELLSRVAADERQAAEDAEPITEDWLESIGWKRWDDRDDLYHGGLYCRLSEWLAWETRLTWHLGCIEAVRMCDPDEADGLHAEAVPLLGVPCSKSNQVTRGDLRHLLAALGAKGGA